MVSLSVDTHGNGTCVAALWCYSLATGDSIYDLLGYVHPFLGVAHSGSPFSTPYFDSDTWPAYNCAGHNDQGWDQDGHRKTVNQDQDTSLQLRDQDTRSQDQDEAKTVSQDSRATTETDITADGTKAVTARS